MQGVAHRSNSTLLIGMRRQERSHSCETEIENLDLDAVVTITAYENVGRPEVAMHHTSTMGGFKTICDLPRNFDGIARANSTRALQQLAQRLPLDQFHHEVRSAIIQSAVIISLYNMLLFNSIVQMAHPIPLAPYLFHTSSPTAEIRH